MEEANIIGVRFTEAGPVTYCRADALDLGIGDYVIVRSERGERLGWVVIAPDQVLASEHQGPMRVIDRLATESDVDAWRANRSRAEEDIGRAQALAARSDPRVRVASIEYDLAGKRCELTFTAGERIQHEWLRRECATLLDADVHIEQVGDRDRAKAAGGVDVCGRALCCSSWMTEFPSITIKMAKDQGIAPNPSKISGVCGRLLCCLSFEVEAYRELRGDLPKVGKRVTTPVGRAKILSINTLKQVVRMRMDATGEVIEIPADELRRQYGSAVRPEELEAAVEEPLRRQDRERQESLVAVLQPVSERAASAGERGPEGEESKAADDGQPKRRRRRGRRGGRRRRKDGGGGESSGGS